MIKEALITGILLMTFVSSGINVKVNLFTGHSVKDVEITQVNGRYLLSSGGNEITILSHGEGITFKAADTAIIVLENGKPLTYAKEFALKGLGIANIFSMRLKGFSVRHYDDDLKLTLHNGAIRLDNDVDLEKYVGGVIQAEAGGSTSLVEYFMVQAIVSRTYAVRLLRNNGPGFCLTDDVSNQVYKGRPVRKEIFEAVEKTKGEIILHNETNLIINAVFHSNSGGFTMASNDVWVSALPYLQPVEDTFSIGQRNYAWTYRMPVVDWLDYLDKTYSFPVHDEEMKRSVLNYTQTNRTKYFVNDILLTRIRGDLKLKSTFFDICVDHDMVVFSGRGFGHGVGLSQEGAIKMAGMGYSAYDILGYYYTGIRVATLSDLQMVASVP